VRGEAKVCEWICIPEQRDGIHPFRQSVDILIKLVKEKAELDAKIKALTTP
jgi:hypothetical protein